MRALIVFVAVLACAAPAYAQDASHWGVSAGFVPKWTFLSQLEQIVESEGGSIDASGSDFRIGLVRGRDLGGEWGVSFIRRKFKEGSAFNEDSGLSCINISCARDALFVTVQDVTMTGLLVHKYVPFVTIKERAQIGISFGGGFANIKGTIEERELFAEYVGNNTLIQGEERRIEDARELFGIKTLPLAQLELAASALVAPGTKVRVSGGFNFPGSQRFSLNVSYLLGSR